MGTVCAEGMATIAALVSSGHLEILESAAYSSPCAGTSATCEAGMVEAYLMAPCIGNACTGTATSPRTLSYNPAENAVLLHSDMDGGSYELYTIPKDANGSTVVCGHFL